MWNFREVDVRVQRIEEQFIHAEVYGLDQQLQYHVTIIYASNKWDKRINLWKDIEHMGTNITHPWIVTGNYNNVITTQDRVGGNNITEREYKYLVEMMLTTWIFEANTKGPHFTWSNKHTKGTVYSRINHILGNGDWFLKYQEANVYVMNTIISDHAPITMDI